MTKHELIANYPRVYHMAESGTWDSIQRHGLLSTNALLDLFEIESDERKRIAERHRPESVTVTHKQHGRAVIRDQKPMSDSALRKCLRGDITPSDWYQTLNKRVFFWVSEDRLNRLLVARAYRSKSHCVLTIDTSELIRRHGDRVTLCPINSGSTIYTPQPRGAETFKSIDAYPFDFWRKKRAGKNVVVELVVEYSVPNIAELILRVEERHGAKLIKSIFSKSKY